MVTADIDGLAVGAVAQSYVLDDAGMIIDRCRILRLPDRFLVLGSLGAGDLLNRWFEQWRQLGWSDLAVFITDASAQWSVLSIAGERSGEVLAKLCGEETALPTAATGAEIDLGGLVARVLASADGTMEFDIHVPASTATALWARLVTAGADAGLTPIELEARNIAAIEAGGLPLHTIYGCRWSVIDFEPVDALKAKQEDFIGKHMALKIAESMASRPQFVRLELDEEDLVVPTGALLVKDKAGRKGAQPAGYVMGSAIDPKAGRAVAIGFLEQGRDAAGNSVSVYFDGKAHGARVAGPIEGAETPAPEVKEAALEDA